MCPSAVICSAFLFLRKDFLCISGCLHFLRSALSPNRDVPDESEQFPPDCSHRLIFVLSSRCELGIAVMQPILCLPGNLFDFFAQLEIALSSEQVASDPRTALVSPRRFHNHSPEMRVAGLGDRASLYSIAAGILARHQSALPHQFFSARSARRTLFQKQWSRR